MAVRFRTALTVREALTQLQELGSDAQVLAGGTDLMVQYLRGEIVPAVLLYIGRLEQLQGIEASNGCLEIGSMVTHRRLASDPVLRQEFPAIAEAAAGIGSWQIQEVATIGGNVCNASPAACLGPPLLVADATVTLEHIGGMRTMPLSDFFVGRRATARQPEELVTRLTVQPAPDRTGECYLKVTRRSTMDVAVVGLAARLTFREDGETVEAARLALCSVAPRPFRAREAEAVLVGMPLDPDLVREAGRLLVEASTPIDDARATAEYRRRVLHPLLSRAVHICRHRATSGVKG
jgi:carbon-monoxide dehydrogenase medium subunit